MIADNPRPSSTSPADKWAVPVVCVLLATAVFLVFGQTLRYGFVNYDDGQHVYQNPQVTKGLTLAGFVWAFTHGYSFNWHPLTWLSHMLDCQLFGLNAGGHHLTNVLLHAATAILLFLVLRQMTGSPWPSAFVAAVFAIHPLRVESVAWISERKDVLSGLFFMLTLLVYARYAEQSRIQGRKAKIFYGLTLLLFALGLLSKPMLVTMPFVLLLLDYWPLNRFESAMPNAQRLRDRILRLVFEKLPFFLLAAASCIITFRAQNSSGAVVPLESIPLSSRLANGLVAYGVYIVKLFWPDHLAVFYPYPARLPAWELITVAAGLLFSTVLAVMFVRARPYFIVGWLWYLGMLVPVIGIVQVGMQSSADRYTYLPQIGLCLILAWVLKDLSGSWRYRRQTLGMVALAGITVLMICAWKQTSCWRDSETLWMHTLSCTSDNDVAHNNLGDILVPQGRVAEAIMHFQKAIQINPADVEPHYNLGQIYVLQGRLDEAIGQYKQAIQLKPDDAEAHYKLGVVFGLRGRLDEAVEQYRAAIEINPHYVDAHGNLANVLAAQGIFDGAIREYQRTLELAPDSPQAHYRFGQVLQAQHQFEAAIGQYQRVLQLDPHHTPALLGLAWLLATCPEDSLRNGKKAVAFSEQARSLTEVESPQMLDTLASAYAEAGQFDEAIKTIQRALELPACQNNQPLAEAIRSRLKLYETHSRFHEKP